MSVESKLVKHPDDEFPQLRINISDTTVVLFTSHSKGTMIWDKGNPHVGRYSETWTYDAFRKFDGEITLRNK